MICLIFMFSMVFADEVEPKMPAVPDFPEVMRLPKLPSFPGFPGYPNENNRSNEHVREILRYDLIVQEAFTNGNTRNNAANTINNAQYVLYSNRTIEMKLFFKNGLEYIYHLANPRSKIEIGNGVFRETFDTTVQAGREFLLEQYTGELSYTNDSVTLLYLMESNKVIVALKFSKKK